MTFQIKNVSTWHNLNRLRDHFLKTPQDTQGISLLINAESGEMNIRESLLELELRVQAPSRPTLHYHHATLLIEKKKGISFRLEAMEPLKGMAAAVIKETMDVLNHVGENSSFVSPKDVLLEVFRSVKMEVPEQCATGRLNGKPGWMGSINREQAEKLLDKAPPGTYLLREGDEYTKKIEYTLAHETNETLHCYLLTLAEKDYKISEKTLVQKGDSWAIYNDDLLLVDYVFKDLGFVVREAGGLQPLKTWRKVA
jgi:hypothetical protein